MNVVQCRDNAGESLPFGQVYSPTHDTNYVQKMRAKIRKNHWLNGRLARIEGEHGHQPEMTVTVLPTQNPTLQPFKISFQRVLPKNQRFRSRVLDGENVDKSHFRLVAMPPPPRVNRPFRFQRKCIRLQVSWPGK